MNASGVLRAPAERPAGQRGIRGAAAAVVTFAALITLTYKEVGLELGISPKTVEHHVSAVLRKLQLSNRHQLSHRAARRRLVD